MLRSPFSGIPYEIGAAYAALAARLGGVLDLLARERIAAADAREAVLQFYRRLRSAASAECTPDELARLFEIAPPGAASSSGQTAPERFALTEAAKPETGAGVKPGSSRFSASQLNTYAECARKWFYRYVCAAVEDKGSAASVYGTAFHAALEDFHTEFPRPGEIETPLLEKRLTACINAAFERARGNFLTAAEFELAVRRARRTGRRYAEWLSAEAKRSPFTVVGCEVSAELQMEGYDFVGYIDRVDRDERSGAVAVIDYKTGTIAASASEYREKVRSFRDFQLPFYYWARTAAGERVWKLALVPLRDARAAIRPIALEVVTLPRDFTRSESPNGVIPIAELENARARMIELCREITSGRTEHYTAATDPDACTFCAYTAACAGRPYPVEERFAR